MGKLASYVRRIGKRLNLAGVAPVDNRESALTRDQIRSWKEDGLLILPGFFGEDRVREMLNHLDDLWNNRRRPDNPLVLDAFVGTPNYKRYYFRDAPDNARDFPYKLNDDFVESEPVREFVLGQELAKILRALLEGDPMVFNSLTFERGSQQEYHFDTFYMPPRERNKMCATWIALEDCHEDAGPLGYYPGSHKIPPYLFSSGKLNAIPEEFPKFRQYIEAELNRRNLKPVAFQPKSGDVLIWHAQLFHGGLPIKDMNRTRKSIVSHYFRASDFGPERRREIGPGRYYFLRPHEKVA